MDNVSCFTHADELHSFGNTTHCCNGKVYFPVYCLWKLIYIFATEPEVLSRGQGESQKWSLLPC